jgi:L-asparagine oxygenase
MPTGLLTELAATLAVPSGPAGRRLVRGLFDFIEPPGATPGHWRASDPAHPSRFDLAVVLAARAVGSVVGWPGQQDGRAVHNILPVAELAGLQVGASSETALAWHTEDAFHPRRAQRLVLVCVRNPGEVGSLVASIREATLTPDDIAVLGRPDVAILPDDSYGRASAPNSAGLPGMSTVWRGEAGLCLRYDPSYSEFGSAGADLRSAYHRLGGALDDAREVVRLTSGDVLVLDNDVVVHGRAAFVPHYDGTDRWLKRVLVRTAGRRPAAEDAESGYGERQIAFGGEMTHR